MPSPAPAPPAQRLHDALDGSVPLARLLERVQASRSRFERVASLLPPALLADVRPGPLDDTSWVLLVARPAAAAKLRQMVPTLEAELAAAGFPPVPLKIRIQPLAG